MICFADRIQCVQWSHKCRKKMPPNLFNFSIKQIVWFLLHHCLNTALFYCNCLHFGVFIFIFIFNPNLYFLFSIHSSHFHFSFSLCCLHSYRFLLLENVSDQFLLFATITIELNGNTNLYRYFIWNWDLLLLLWPSNVYAHHIGL